MVEDKQLILVISNSKSRAEEIARLTEKAGLYQCLPLALNTMSAELFENSKYRAAVFDFDVLNQIELVFLKGVASRHPDIPLVILAQQISIFAYRSVAQMQNMTTLQKPFEMQIYSNVLEKLCDPDMTGRFRHPRFVTDEPVRMMVMRNGLLVPTKMKNYSAGGAFLEYRGISVRVGDKLQLSLGDQFQTRPTDRFQLQAKVIWIKEGDQFRAQERGIGIQFL